MEVQIEVPADSVKAEIDKAYLALGKSARVPGFRPGKTPRDVLIRFFSGKVASDVMQTIVGGTLDKALASNQIMPLSQPQVEAASPPERAAAFSYKARFEVQPEVGAVKFEQFELKRPNAEVTDEMVAAQVDELRTRMAALVEPEAPRPSATGDVVTVDFRLSIDGKEIADAAGNGVQVELGAGQFLPELEAVLIGKNIGETATAESPFSATHPRADFREKTGHFSLTLKGIKEKKLAALDDEFAKDVGGFESLDALRAGIRTRLEREVKGRVETALAEQIVTKLNEANELEVPPSLVTQQRRMMEQEFVQQMRRLRQQMTEEQLHQIQGQMHADAERKVRAGLLMAAIAKSNGLTVTDEDVEKAYVEIAEETGKNVAKVKAEYREQSQRQMLLGMVLEDKVLTFIEGKSVIVDEAAA